MLEARCSSTCHDSGGYSARSTGHVLFPAVYIFPFQLFSASILRCADSIRSISSPLLHRPTKYQVCKFTYLENTCTYLTYVQSILTIHPKERFPKHVMAWPPLPFLPLYPTFPSNPPPIPTQLRTPLLSAFTNLP